MDEQAFAIKRQEGLRAAMDEDVSKVQMEFRAQRGLLQSLHLTQQEHTALLNEHSVRLTTIEGRLENVEGRLEKVEGTLDKVHTGVEAIRQMLDRTADGGT